MRKIISSTLFLAFILFWGCTGTQDCRVSGLEVGQPYSWIYTDSDGHLQAGEFTPNGDTYIIHGVDSGINCSDVNVDRVFIMEFSMV